jgi:molybdenum cofactor cytidylyltransferase
MTRTNEITRLARELRRKQTREEALLWESLRNRKFKNLKFLRQHPIVYDKHRGGFRFFIADFYCAELRLVIEVDGPIHEFQQHYDKNRDAILRDLRMRVIRIKNEELKDVDGVLRKLMNGIQTTLPPTPSLQSREGVSERSEDGGESPVIPIIILAAGSSSRLGQPKQLLEIEGETLIHRITRQAVESNTGPVVVVLGSQADLVQKNLHDLPVHFCMHADWQNGIGSSIKAGLQVVEKKFPGAAAVILSVCDQPFLEEVHFKKLRNAFRKKEGLVVASRYANTFGVPCLFSKECFPALKNLRDDQGAKPIIEAHQDKASFISFPNGEQDIDTIKDWEALQNIVS